MSSLILAQLDLFHEPDAIGGRRRPVAQVMDEFVFASGFTGYDEEGEAHPTSDSYAAIMAANEVARARNKELILSGRPRIKSPILLAAPTRWRMQGQHFKPGHLDGGACIIKDGALNGTAIHIGPDAWQTVLEGIGLLGMPGNGGDGFHVEGNTCSLINCSVQGMGQDGLRLGAKAGTSNCDCFSILNFNTAHNVRDGIHINDLSATINANSGLILRPVSILNGRHGIYINRANWGNVILAPLFESNTGKGVYLDAEALQNVFIGGDIEANVGGNVFEAVAFKNRFIEAVIQGVQTNTLLQNGSFTPSVIGTTAAGTATYTSRRGFYSIVGRRVLFEAELEWIQHVGTGNLRVGGFPLATNAVDANIPNFIPVDVVGNGIALAANEQLFAGFNHNLGQIVVWKSALGTLANLAMSATGTLYLRGSYIPNLPS